MRREGLLELVTVAVGLFILLCASTAIGINLGRFLRAIWR
jgi:hypothetical protein